MKSDYIEPKKFAVLLATMRHDNALAVRVSLETGLRIGDVLALRVENLGENGEISTVCQKTEKPFTGKVSRSTAFSLTRNASRASGWLFPSPRNRQKHKTRQAVWRDLTRAAARCGVRLNITPHSARKIHAVETFRKDGLDGVQRELQHDRVTTSLLYAFADKLTTERPQRASLAEAPEEASAFVMALVNNLGGAGAVYAAIRAALNEIEA